MGPILENWMREKKEGRKEEDWMRRGEREERERRRRRRKRWRGEKEIEKKVNIAIHAPVRW